MRYHFSIKARRVVEDTLTLSVDAESLSEAKKVATNVALSFPSGLESVTYCYIENRDIVNSEIVDLERVVPKND